MELYDNDASGRNPEDGDAARAWLYSPSAPLDGVDSPANSVASNDGTGSSPPAANAPDGAAAHRGSSSSTSSSGDETWIDNIPAELKRLDRWVLWRKALRPRADGSEGWTKVPMRALRPDEPASATDPATWSSFAQTLRSHRFLRATGLGSDGIGFVLGPLEGTDLVISGVDLDDCIGPDGALEEWARDWIERLGGYAEVSPSGEGVKVFVLGAWSGGKSYEVLRSQGRFGRGQIEIAREHRFFAVTGRLLAPEFAQLRPASEVLQELHGLIEAQPAVSAASKSASPLATGPPRRPLPREQLAGMTPLEKFTAQLEAMGIEYRKSGDWYSARCPVHEDRNPSFGFTESEGGRLGVHCHGCGAEYAEIMEAVGLLPADGFPGPHFATSPHRREATFSGNPAFVTEVDPALIERFTAENDVYVEALWDHPDQLAELSRRLGVSKAALEELQVGWRGENRVQDEDGAWRDLGPAWTFPEKDGRERIVGIQRRFVDGSVDKRVIPKSRRGLYIPLGWAELPGPIYIPEGVSDVAALLARGRCAIGRPSATGGARMLAELLQGVDRRIIVLAENDRKPDGRWPGKEGAERVASELHRLLGRETQISYPPDGCKDIREALNR